MISKRLKFKNFMEDADKKVTGINCSINPFGNIIFNLMSTYYQTKEYKQFLILQDGL